MTLLLTWLSVALVLVVMAVLAFGLIQISGVLRAIGGTPTSFLAKLRLGLRAIDTETSHLAPQVTKLNTALTEVAGGLGAVDQRLVGTLKAALEQEGR